MKTYHDLLRLTKKARVIALGNFDGVHCGHQPIIEHAVKMAKELEAESAVFLFDPHPMERLFPERNYPLLTTPLQRGAILKELGIECLILADFNEEMMRMPPIDFVQALLFETCGAVGLSVGYDYSFGYQGLGNVALLQELAEGNNLHLSVQPVIEYLDLPISSTRIKQAIHKGDFSLANCLLGRMHQIHARLDLQTSGSYEVRLWPNLIVPQQGKYAIEIESEKWGRHHGEFIITRPGVYRVEGVHEAPQDSWLTIRFLSDSTSNKA